MAAIDVSLITPEIASQIGSVIAIGIACLSVYWLIDAFRYIRESLGYGSSDHRTFDEKYAAGDAVEGVDFVTSPVDDRR